MRERVAALINNPNGERPPRRRIAVAGGGTAGHVNPGIAILMAYRTVGDTELCFIGCGGGFECPLIRASGFVLHLVPGSPFARQNLIGKLRSAVGLLQGVSYARELLRRKQINLVIGVGGYASAGAVLAARTLGIRTVIHEANVIPGLANRVLGLLVDRVCVTWGSVRKWLPSNKLAITGTPVLSEIVDLGTSERAFPATECRRILVTGGSEGSTFLNEHVPTLLEQLQTLGIKLTVHHQTGGRPVEEIRQKYADANIPATVEPFIGSMAEAYSQADFVIASAGAITLAELAIFGLPCLLVPSAHVANDHQKANAMAYAGQTGDLWCSEAEWDSGNLASRISTLLSDPNTLQEQADKSRRIASPNAARAVVNECESLMSGKW